MRKRDGREKEREKGESEKERGERERERERERKRDRQTDIEYVCTSVWMIVWECVRVFDCVCVGV